MTETYPPGTCKTEASPGRRPHLSQLETLTRPLNVDLRAVFDQSPIGIAVCSAQGRLLDANPSCLGICGFRQVEDALGMDVFGHLAVTPEHREALSRGNTVQFETSLAGAPSSGGPIRGGGAGAPHRVHVHAKITPLAPRQDGEPEAYLAHIEDISERKLAQETYQALVKGSLQGLALFQGGRIVFANQRLAAMTGYTVEELQAMSAQEVATLVHPEDRAMVVERLRQRLAGVRDGEQYAVRFIRRDGTVRWVQLSAQRIDYAGAPAVQASYVDITEKKRAEEVVARSEQRYRRLFQESPVSLWEEDFSAVKAYLDQLSARGAEELDDYLDDHPECVTECMRLLHVLAVNKATLELYGAASAEELNQNLGTVMGEEARPAFREQLLCIADDRPLPQTETVNHTLDGDRLELLVEMRVVPGHEETYARVLVSLLDVTERHRMEDALQQQQLMTALSQMAAGIAHDFRSLLTTVILHAQMGLRVPGLPPQAVPHLRTIVSESQRASDLIQKILDFTSSAMLDTKTFDLECVVSDTLDELESQCPPTIDLVMETHPGPFLVRADPDRIAQALENLMLNARDAVLAKQPSDDSELRVSLRRISVENPEKAPCTEVGTGEWICLRVSDTGTGMPEEVCEHVFEPFFTTREVGEGTGLGLPQVYGIVRQHDGVIDFESEPGEGTTFHIYLPAYEGGCRS